MREFDFETDNRINTYETTTVTANLEDIGAVTVSSLREAMQSSTPTNPVSRRTCLKGAITATVAALSGIEATGTTIAANNLEESSQCAEITFNNQRVKDGSLTVEWTSMADGGFVTIHDTRLLDGIGAGSIIGVSEF